MAKLEERVERAEHEIARVAHENAELKRAHADLKNAIEVLAVALGALVNKAVLGRLDEKSNKIFDTSINHDQFTE